MHTVVGKLHTAHCTFNVLRSRRQMPAVHVKGNIMMKLAFLGAVGFMLFNILYCR
jgi:hypothetical protein